MKIEELINSIGASVTQAYNEIEFNSVNGYLRNYFNISEDESGDTYSPHMIKFALPSAVDGDTDTPVIINTPMAALVSNRSMNLDSVKVSINIDAKEDNGELQVNPSGTNTQSDALLPKGGSIELTFKRSQCAEGMARIETHLYQML